MKFTVRRDSAGRDRLCLNGEFVPFLPSPNVGGWIKPTLQVKHNTSSWLRKGAAVEWMRMKKAKVSAHIAIERDGAVVQLVPLNREAWHAGRSSWRGTSGCNDFSIGVELVGPGKLTQAGRAWFGGTFPGGQYARTSAHGAGWWLPYTPEQIAADKAITAALAAHYRTADVAGHYEISPGRKIDPNPLYPMTEIKRIAEEAAQGGGDAVDAPPAAVAPSRPADAPVAIKPAWPLTDGSEGPVVVAVQHELRKLGFDPGPLDPTFGPRTRSAVIAWQDLNGFPADGKLTAAQYDALIEGACRALPRGPVSQAEDQARATAGARIEQIGKAAAGAAIAEGTTQAASGESLWGTITGYIGELAGTLGQVTGVGVQIDPKFALIALGCTVGLALIVYVRTVRS